MTDKNGRGIDGDTGGRGPAEGIRGSGGRVIDDAPDTNVAFVRNALGGDAKLIVKRRALFKAQLQSRLVYLDVMADKKTIASQILEPLSRERLESGPGRGDLFEAVLSSIAFPSAAKTADRMDEVLDALVGGSAILFISGEKRALIFDTRLAYHRAVGKPENEATMLAAQESLTESLEINCNLIMKRLKNRELKFREFTAGTLSGTNLRLLWIEGVASPPVIEEAERRLNGIDTDIVDGIGVLAELIRDRPASIFPTYRQTQRSDVVARCLADGQFAVLADNCCFAFIAPCSFWDQFKTSDDYAQSAPISTYLRLVRYVSFIICTTVSALYLACVTHNHSIVPPELATAIATGRDGVPLPSIVEILLLTFTISIIREASLRLPGSTGYFIGTMSAIVIGQAAVAAGYISASVIIVISISVISSYAISSSVLLYSTRLINYFLILLAGAMGMFGLINGILVVIWYMLSLKSFGLPYLYPLVPFEWDGLKDSLVKAPAKALTKRLRLLAPANRIRTGRGGASKRDSQS